MSIQYSSAYIDGIHLASSDPKLKSITKPNVSLWNSLPWERFTKDSELAMGIMSKPIDDF